MTVMAHNTMTILLVSITLCVTVCNTQVVVKRRPLKCARVFCGVLLCKNGARIQTPPDQCCPVCGGLSQCFYKGKVYKDGQRFKDDCNTCWCRNGRVGCTDMGCPRKGCFYKGKFYKDGASFKDECNTCSCQGGSVLCTLMGCGNKPGICPTIFGFVNGICVERCTGDWSCKGVQKCCSNGCGHVCKNPVFFGKPVRCYRNGKYYKDGDKVPSISPCESCFCRTGKITCSKTFCVAQFCLGRSYTPHGACCPICGSGILPIAI